MGQELGSSWQLVITLLFAASTGPSDPPLLVLLYLLERLKRFLETLERFLETLEPLERFLETLERLLETLERFLETFELLECLLAIL